MYQLCSCNIVTLLLSGWCVQRLPPGSPDVFVTLNPETPPAAGAVLRRLSMSHPVFSIASDTAQQQLPALQVGSDDGHSRAKCSAALAECPLLPAELRS